MVRMRELIALVLILLVIQVPSALADVMYDWVTLSATYNGMPTNLFTAFGNITLTDAGQALGFGSVTTTEVPFSQTLNGVAEASFGFSNGPTYVAPGNDIVNFTATVDGQFLHVTPINLYGGFFVNSTDTDAYYGVNGPNDILIVGYGTDNANSPCFGPQQPSVSHCVVTGVFELVSVAEPGPSPVLAGVSGLFVLLLWRERTRRSTL